MVSIGFSFVKVGLVDVSNSSQIGDDSGGDFLVSGVLLVSSNLGLEVLGFQISQEIVN